MVRQQMPQGSPANMSMLLPFFAQRAADQLITGKRWSPKPNIWDFALRRRKCRMIFSTAAMRQRFFPGGNFIGKQEYEDMLARANLTPPIFEEEVRKELLLEKLRALISGGASVSDDQIASNSSRKIAR